MDDIILDWEKIDGNGAGVLLPDREGYAESAPFQKFIDRFTIAKAKVDDVKTIDAMFDTEYSYCSLLKLYISSPDAVYKHYHVYVDFDFGNDSDNDFPAVLLRKSTWDNKSDYIKLKSSDDAIQYFLSDQQLVVDNFFMMYKDVENLICKIKQVSELCKHGILFENSNGSCSKFNNIELYVSNTFSTLMTNLAWSCSELKNNILEQWIEEYILCYENIDFHKAVSPKNKINIWYGRNMVKDLLIYR